MTHYHWRTFFEKIIDMISMYFLAPFIAQNSLTMHHFWIQNNPLALKDIFRKTINLILMYFLASWIMQKSTKSSEHIQSSESMSFLETRWSCGSGEFSRKNFHTFDVNLGLFTLFVKIQKSPSSVSRVMVMYYFWAQNNPNAPNETFSIKKNIILIYRLTFLIVQIWRKYLEWIQS